MALDAELSNLKSAGTYRYERDLSTISSDTTSYGNLRLVVGFSKIGPFNSPQLCTSVAEFTKLFGNIDRSLEKRGSYFHRSALVALSAGPILALNLLNLDPDLDQVREQSVSLNIDHKNPDGITLPLVGLYNTDKFWFASDECFLDTIKKYLSATAVIDPTDAACASKELIHFANVGKKPISILLKKSSSYNTTGYDITANDWYGAGNVPEYINGTSYVSDYLVDLYVVEGDFGPATKTSKYITTVDLDDDDEPEVLTKYHVLEEDEEDYANPYERFTSDIVFQDYFDKYGFKRKINDADTSDTRLAKFLNLPAVKLIARYTGSLIPNFVDKLGRNIWIQKLVNDDTLTTGLLCTENVPLIEEIDEIYDDEQVFPENIDIVGHGLYANGLTEDDINMMSYVPDGSYEQIKTAWTVSSYDADPTGLWTTKAKAAAARDDSEDTGDVVIKGDNEVILDYEKSTFTLVVGDRILSIYKEIEDEETDESEETIKFSRLTRITEIKGCYNSEGKKVAVKVVCADKVTKFDESNGLSGKCIYQYKCIDDFCQRLRWFTLNGFKVRKDLMPDGTNERQNEILDMLRENPLYATVSNLYKTLIDRDYIQWRYLVDTFGYGLEEECKNVYTLLCQGRQSAFALINCPSQNDFKTSIDPSFINEKGSVEAEFIAAGGDQSKTPSFLFSLPTLENGASWGAYYYPYLRIVDLSAVKNVPPAAYVSNLYMSKYNLGHAWSIVAGQKRGVISGNQVTGVEATLVHDNRDYLEPVGINSIIWENGVGVEVYGNKTAKQSPKSALSSAHVRECCIYIQDQVEDILRKYIFEMNTAQTRLEIKTLVDNFLETVKSGSGIYDYKTVMDTSNNTQEVIDNNQGVIDIFIEPVRGLEMLTQRLTILKTGAIESGELG